MRAVVTGGAGFIGSHVTDALIDAGWHVTVIDDFSAGRNPNLEKATELARTKGLQFRVLRDSITDEATWKNLESADLLVHFAAQTSVSESVLNSKKDFNINVLSVHHIVNWVREKRVRMLVYANTAGAMYGKPAYFPTDERTLVKPLCPYGATKAFFEIYLNSVCESLKASRTWSSEPRDSNYFSWAAVRLANVYGPRQITKGEAGVIPIFVERMAKGETPTIFGDGDKTRDYVHVSDVVSAVMMSVQKMQQTSLDEGFNIATGVETRDIDLYHAVVRAMHEMGSDPDSPAAYKNSLKVPLQPIFAAIRPGEASRSVMDIMKAAAILGWRPKVDFYNGLKDTVNTYFEHSDA